MATMRPNAVVIKASAMPADTAPSEPPPPDAAMPVNAFTMPITVPSSPTNGAVEPVVARIPRPRFSSADTMRISRSTARSTELMSAAGAPLASLLVEPEVDGNLKQHPHRPAVHPRGPEQRFEHVALGRLIEAGVGALKHLDGIRLGPSERVDDRLHQHAALNLRLPQQLRELQRGSGEHRGLLLDDRFHEHFVAGRYHSGREATLDTGARVILRVEMLMALNRT